MQHATPRSQRLGEIIDQDDNCTFLVESIAIRNGLWTRKIVVFLLVAAAKITPVVTAIIIVINALTLVVLPYAITNVLFILNVITNKD